MHGREERSGNAYGSVARDLQSGGPISRRLRSELRVPGQERPDDPRDLPGVVPAGGARPVSFDNLKRDGVFVVAVNRKGILRDDPGAHRNRAFRQQIAGNPAGRDESSDWPRLALPGRVAIGGDKEWNTFLVGETVTRRQHVARPKDLKFHFDTD